MAKVMSKTSSKTNTKMPSIFLTCNYSPVEKLIEPKLAQAT